MFFADVLAGAVTSPVGQAALAAHPGTAQLLEVNNWLASDVWIDLWGANPSLVTARRLSAMRLDPAQTTHLLARERRPTVLRSVLYWNEVTLEQGSALLARRLDPRTAHAWVDSGMVPEELLEQACATARRNPATARCLSRHWFDQEQMLAALHEDVPQVEQVLRAVHLYLNPNAGPEVIDAAQQVQQQAVDAGEGGVLALPEHVNRWTTFGYAVDRPWEEADTPQELRLLAALRQERLPHAVRQALRASPYRLGLVPGTLDPTVGLEALEVPAGDGVRFYLGARNAALELEKQLDQAGPAAWQVAAALLADRYAGTVAELLETARALSAAERPVSAEVAVGSCAAAPDGLPAGVSAEAPVRVSAARRPPAQPRFEH
jgi:hypothetical protein